MRAAAIACAVLLAGCGARTSLVEGTGGSSASSTGSAGASSSSSSGSGGAPGCTWTFDPAVVDIGVAHQQFPEDAAIDGETILVTFFAGGSVKVRAMPANLSSIGTVADTGANLGALAVGFETRMVIGGAVDVVDPCAALRLDDSGAPIGAVATIAGSKCYFPVATPAGAMVLAAPPDGSYLPAGLTLLDAAANVVATQAGAIPTNGVQITTPLARVGLDDGTLLVVWQDGLTAYVRGFSSAGVPLYDPKPLFTVGLGAEVALTSLGSSALVTWHPGGTGGPGGVHAASLSKEGTLGERHLVAAFNAQNPPDGLDLVATADGSLVWMGADPQGLMVQPVDAAGAVTQAALTRTLPDAEFVAVVRALPTAAGAVVIGRINGKSKTIATSVRCRN